MRHAFAETFADQRERWILWLPAGVIAGAAAWIASPTDPPFWLGPAVFLGAAAASCTLAFWHHTERHLLRRVGAGLFALIAAIGLGACVADIKTRLLAQPVFAGSDDPVRLTGWVTEVDAGDSGPRLRILVRDIEGVAAPPRYVRVAVPARAIVTPGRGVSCRAVLRPPAGPLAPGGYDFARHAYFERLGASGFAYGPCRTLDIAPPPALFDQLALKLAALRYDLSATLQSIAPGRGGAIAAAIVAGDRSGIDPNTNQALQNSGVGHLLSVGGEHMSVVGGLVFALLALVLSLIPPLALRIPVKKIAATGALVALVAYVTISGFNVPSLRALVMAGVAFGAILLDRPAISMRGVALAAFVSVLLFPETVLDPSFQMTFAATLALVALFEIMRRPREENTLPTPGPLIGALQWSSRAIGAVILVSLVAGVSTDPFALYHFQRFALYALPANLVVAPIMSFLVAPAAMAAAIAAPFGWAEPPLKLMASALDLIAAIGDAFGQRPEAVRALPRPTDLAFALCAFALVWACLWRGAWRWGAVFFFAISAWLYLTEPRPVAAFDGDFRAVFARDASAHNAWRLAQRSTRSTYARDHLGAILGISPSTLQQLPQPDACNDALCNWRMPSGRQLIFVRTDSGFAQACVRGAIVIARQAALNNFATSCHPAALMDQRDVARSGGGLIYETATGLRIVRAQPPSSRRPWTPHGLVDED